MDAELRSALDAGGRPRSSALSFQHGIKQITASRLPYSAVSSDRAIVFVII